MDKNGSKPRNILLISQDMRGKRKDSNEIPEKRNRSKSKDQGRLQELLWGPESPQWRNAFEIMKIISNPNLYSTKYKDPSRNLNSQIFLPWILKKSPEDLLFQNKKKKERKHDIQERKIPLKGISKKIGKKRSLRPQLNSRPQQKVWWEEQFRRFCEFFQILKNSQCIWKYWEELCANERRVSCN